MTALDMRVVTVGPGRAREVVDLLNQTSWATGRSAAAVAQTIEYTTVSVGIENPSHTLVAYARAQSDTTYQAHIHDVVVDRLEAGNGLGALLMKALLTHPLVVSCEHVHLFCKTDIEKFYQQFGFETMNHMGTMTLTNRAGLR